MSIDSGNCQYTEIIDNLQSEKIERKHMNIFHADRVFTNAFRIDGTIYISHLILAPDAINLKTFIKSMLSRIPIFLLM